MTKRVADVISQLVLLNGNFESINKGRLIQIMVFILMYNAQSSHHTSHGAAENRQSKVMKICTAAVSKFALEFAFV